MKNNTQNKPSIDKTNFIDFLASATPEEVNKYILEKGKPRKNIWPMYFFPIEDDEKKEMISK